MFTIKVNQDGIMARLKARIVAKGYAKTYGVDYLDTFSPVSKLTSVRLFISLAASESWVYINWISRMHFFMVMSKRKCIWSYHPVLLLGGGILKFVT